jgi:hypothetical protein
VPYSRFQDGVSPACIQTSDGNKRKRDEYEENDLILQKETDARNDG